MCVQRADLAARLTRLSVSPDWVTLEREDVNILMIAEEWKGLKSLKVCGEPSSLDIDSLKPVLASLEHLDVRISQVEALRALIANEEAG